MDRTVPLLAAALLTLPAAAAAMPAPFDAAVEAAGGTLALYPADPRTEEARADAPDAADGLLEGTLPGGGDVHLVRTADGTAGLAEVGDVLVPVSVQDGTLAVWNPDVPAPAAPGALEGDAAEAPPAPEALPPTTAADTAPDGTLDLLLDADAEYVDEHGDEWDDHQLRVVHLLDAILEHNLGTNVSVTEQHGWQDPSSQPLQSYELCASSDLLSEFRAHWEGARPTTDAPRDAAHLFTGKNTVGTTIGCAFVQELDTSYAYGVSEVRDGASTYGRMAEIYQDTILVAHEIGHNYGGEHGRALPGPGTPPSSLYCYGATLMYPTLCAENPTYSGQGTAAADGLAQGTPAADLVSPMGNAPPMRDYADGRI